MDAEDVVPDSEPAEEDKDEEDQEEDEKDNEDGEDEGDAWDELAREERMAKKLKRGNITQSDFDMEFSEL